MKRTVNLIAVVADLCHVVWARFRDNLAKGRKHKCDFVLDFFRRQFKNMAHSWFRVLLSSCRIFAFSHWRGERSKRRKFDRRWFCRVFDLSPLRLDTRNTIHLVSSSDETKTWKQFFVQRSERRKVENMSNHLSTFRPALNVSCFRLFARHTKSQFVLFQCLSFPLIAPKMLSYTKQKSAII